MPDGGFFVYADVSRFSDDSERFCRDVLEGAGVAVTPGIDFGRHRAAASTCASRTRSAQRSSKRAWRDCATFLRR